MRTMLWNGDAIQATGFERVTRYVLDVARKTYNVEVLGINYNGDPHPFPYRIWPCIPGGDAFGIGRVEELLRKVTPDVLVLQNDPWNVSEYVSAFASKVPIVAYMPVDGKNCRGRELNGLAMGIFYTDFALREAVLGGYTGPACVVPLGVDLGIYRPMEKHAAREILGFYKLNKAGRPNVPPDAFVVGNVNRNQPRKRLDLTIEYFAEWVRRGKIDNAWLYLHLAPTGDSGWDTQQLANYYGIGDRIIYTHRRFEIGVGVPEAKMPIVYSAFDAQISTTQGEGFGLCTIEGMACGIAQIVPDWSALGDWIEDGAALKIPCTTFAATPNGVNAIGGLPDKELTIAALDRIYRDAGLRAELGAAGQALAERPKFRWQACGEGIVAAIDLAMEAPPPLAAAEVAPCLT